MNSNGTSKRRPGASRLLVVSALIVVGGFSSCAERSLDREITDVRRRGIRPDSSMGMGGRVNAPSGQNRPSGGADSSGPRFDWETPEGWSELPPTQERAANFQVGSESECYLTILPGKAGGLVDNVNRWRQQIGLEPQSSDEIDALPKRALFDMEATIVDLEGAYKGMGDNAVEGSALLGAILVMADGMVFVKMTGPSEVVRSNRDKFDLFCSSLRLHVPTEHDHSSHAPGAHDADKTSGSSSSSGGLAWTAPEHWVVDASKTMRVVSYTFGESGSSECGLSVLGGGAGGVEANINRWRSQVGAPALSAAELNALPKLNILGVESPWMEAYGNFSGMGADDLSSAGIVGAICNLGNQTLFIKMLGTAAELRDERENFIGFCESLRME